MTAMKRYAVFYTPAPGAFAHAGAQWLGWDAESGLEPTPPGDLDFDLAAMTARPRRYGFHGTLKPPFELVSGATFDALSAQVAELAARHRPMVLPRLVLEKIGRFLALQPEGDIALLTQLAARVVEGLEPFRAPLSPADRARRRPDRLSAHQRALLDRYGYPYVMDEFRFHLTLTAPLSPEDEMLAEPAARRHFAPFLGHPLVIDDLTLCGEDHAGRFHILSRHRLGH